MQTEEIKNFYNSRMKGGRNYEGKRWFKNKIQRAGYEMTLSALRKYVLGENFSRCLEVGPGHGTWTARLLETHPEAEFDLVDLSEEMLELSRTRFASEKNFSFYRSDFFVFNPAKQYDFFFSSRALEYMPDKEAIVKKISSLLSVGAGGFIITKTPKYLRSRLFGRKIPDVHCGQITSRKLTALLKVNGLDVAAVCPVALSFPFFNSPCLNKLLYKIFGGRELNFLSKFFSESYGVKFRKR